ncbi:MAG: hypothetical protein R6V12_04335 [Candidatus Hydrogenedentota bacterium]
MTTPGYFSLVLHSHLPYVISHGRWPHGMDWLNEAAAETYIPLLETIDRLVVENISPKWTVGLTPILTEMLDSDTFKSELDNYLASKIEASENDIEDFSRTGRTEMESLATWWRDHFQHIFDLWEHRYEKDLVSHFKDRQDSGHIEIITCGATHGYFPLLSEDISIQAQVKQGKASYKRHFGANIRPAKKIWSG